MAAERPPLENNANNSSPPLPTPLVDGSRRDRRYGLRSVLWTYSDLPRLHKCGRTRITGHVGVRYSGGGAGFSGLASCGSVWACPVCSAKILARRSLEIGVGLLTWENGGGRLVMGTLTMRHHKGHRLAQEWAALNKAWAAVTCSRVWKKWLARLGSPGLVRVVEVTHGWANGWHVHLHFVLLVAGSVAVELVAEFSAWVTAKWSRALVLAGMPGALVRGQDVHLVRGVQAATEVGQYLVKASAFGSAESLGRELMGTWSKTARSPHGTEPAWLLAEEFGRSGEVDLLDLWHEYEQGSRGKRQCTWSQGLRDLLAVGAEQTDEDVAAEVLGDVDLVRITAEGWTTALRSHQPTSRILAAVEHGGVAGLTAYLDEHGIDYERV